MARDDHPNSLSPRPAISGSISDSDKDKRMACKHFNQDWTEVSFTAGGWNIRVFCTDCGRHIGFRRLADVVG